MGKQTGFLEYEREDGPVVCEAERIKNFDEFHGLQNINKQQIQAARCMNCGTPFCQAGTVIAGMAVGCPLNNLVPELNDLVYQGCFEQAYRRLEMTHSFPEFTSRVCPALCEHACTCSLDGEAVSTKENEKTVIEYAFEHNLVKEVKPEFRTGKKVAVIGSGPSGLACAQLLNSRGHEVTVYERNDRVGGLLRYGIPNMKLDKKIIDRRIKLMEDAGIKFVVNANVSTKNEKKEVACAHVVSDKVKNIDAKEILNEYDAVVLACGASNPRDINVTGRDAKGIYFAVDFLSKVTKSLEDNNYEKFPFELAKDKNVVVIGGGDTGNDCVGTSIRLGAKSVTQLEMMPCPPTERLESNPWPEWPKVLKIDYGQEEAIYKFGNDPRVYQTTVKEFIKDKKGELKSVITVSVEFKKDKKTGRMVMKEVARSEKEIKAELVLIAAGFLGSEEYVTKACGVETNERTNVKTAEGSFETSKKGVYVVGDMHSGQSLVVRAIAEGRKAAKQIDYDLMGYTNL